MGNLHSFSIFLLKDNYNEKNALKSGHSLEEDTLTDGLPKGATLYILDKHAITPWWKTYFNIKRDLKQTLKGAILFLPVDNKNFAITFGHTRHNLEPESYEYDFGLRTTLNIIDPNELKNVDSSKIIKKQKQRTQAPVGSNLDSLDFDHDSTILKSLTGKVKEEYKEIFRNVTGESNILISSSKKSSELPGLCKKLLELYSLEDYKENFPEIHNIQPVKDPTTIKKLDDKLVNALKLKDDNIVLVIPDSLDYSGSVEVTFSGTGRSLEYEDVLIEHYYEYMDKNGFNITDIDLMKIKKHTMSLKNYSNNSVTTDAIFKCLLFDTTINDNSDTYYLNEGNWYRVNKDYIIKLRNFLDPLCSKTTLLPYNHKDEETYNKDNTINSSFHLCMDRENISPIKKNSVEPCDILELNDEKIILHHVKRTTNSAALSHLFNQGTNSIRLIREEEVAFKNLKELTKSLLDGKKLSDDEKIKLMDAFDIKKMEVFFQIITKKNPQDKSSNFPLFSRISLYRMMKEFKRLGINATYSFVENQAEISVGKEKKKKKKAT